MEPLNINRKVGFKKEILWAIKFYKVVVVVVVSEQYLPNVIAVIITIYLPTMKIYLHNVCVCGALI